MKALKKINFCLAAVVAFSFILAGCNLDLSETSMSANTAAPSTGGQTERELPRVTTNPPTLEVLTYSTGGTVDNAVAPYNYRIVINFSERMLSSTITTTSVYVNDVSSTPAVITGQTLTMDEETNSVYIEWSSDTDYLPAGSDVPLEVVVEDSVTDLSGNAIAGFAAPQHFGNAYPFNEMAADFRDDVAAAGTWTNLPVWAPATVTLSQVNLSTTSVTVTATFNNNQMDASTITADNFSSSAGTIQNFTSFAANVVTFDVTGLTATTEYTITFDPTGILIDTATVLNGRLYPDDTTVLGTLDTQIYDDYDGTKGNRSSYTMPFMMNYDAVATTPPTITSATDRTASIYPGFEGGTDRVVSIYFDTVLDAATLLSANFIVLNAASDELQVDVSPYYIDGDTELLRVLISTMDYSEDQIQFITIRDGVTCNGIQLDGDGDGALEGNTDYNQNDTPDDWVRLTNGVHF